MKDVQVGSLEICLLDRRKILMESGPAKGNSASKMALLVLDSLQIHRVMF